MSKRKGPTIGEAMVAQGKAIDPLCIYQKIDDFDMSFMDTEETLKAFMSFCTSAMFRYRYNEEQGARCDGDQEDLLHEIELHPLKNAFNGFRIYRKLKDIREERRKCKDENSVLFPMMEMLKAHPEFLSELEATQTKCEDIKKLLKNRKYKVRGTVLQEMGFCSENSF